MSAVGPRMARGIWCASSRVMPAASMPTAVAGGGMEECPPSACAVNSTVTYPFSAIPMSAAGAARPVISPVASAPPSSSTNSGCTLRAARSSAMRAAPRRPPTSSSYPNARYSVRRGFVPAATRCSTASSNPTRLPLSSRAPRPHTYPAAIRPSNGGSVQRPSVPGSIGTTSWWASRTSGASPGSEPVHSYSRP